MDAERVMRRLSELGKPGTAAIYRRHGAKGPCFGVSYADLVKLEKELGADQRLARELWKTKNHDARVLAAKVADPDALDASLVRAWLAEADNYVVTDAVASLVSHMRDAKAIALGLSRERGEWASSAGFSALAIAATAGKLTTAEGRALLKRIGRDLAGAPNRTRHAMNGALIAIGGSMSELFAEAVEVAKKLGTVEVDHGQTGCKTPDAVSYMKKMAGRAAKRPRLRAKTAARSRGPAGTRRS